MAAELPRTTLAGIILPIKESTARSTSIDYRSGEGTVDGITAGPMWQEELDRKHEAYQIQKAYQMMRKEIDDVAPNLLPRESLPQRHARLTAAARAGGL